MTSQGALASRGERKFAVALFADLSGYTAMCERLDPEDVELTVAPLMSALRSTVEADGGVIANIAGDGFFAIFGVPTALADAPSRAARSAQSLRDLVAARNAQPGLAQVPEVHVGVASGEVLVTPSNDPPGWSVIGSAVNLASRLCDLAAPGEVLFDEATHRLAGAELRWAGTRELQVRGHDRSVIAWELVGLEPSPGSTSRVIPFVGRADVLAQLDAEWQHVTATATSRVRTVSGEAGIGKSRLVSHWLDECCDGQSLWLWCGGTVTGQPIGRLLDLLVSRTGEPTPDIRALQAPSSLNAPTSYRADPFPMLIAATRRLLERAAAIHPLVLVVDDVHAADASLVELLANLREQPLNARLLILCTQRTGASVTGLQTDIEVSPLPPAETEAVIAAALGARPPETVRAAIVRRVQGHPLMALQSAAYLIEAGVVSVADDECELVSPGAVDVLPTSLRLFVSARLDQLPAAEKSVVQELSTFGDESTEDWIETVLGRHARQSLPGLGARGLLTISGSGGWRFAHGLVQEVAYASLTRRTRSELHKRQLGLLPDDATAELRAYHALAWAASVPAAEVTEAREAGMAALRETLRLSKRLYATEARAAHQAIRRVRDVIDDLAAAHAPTIVVQLLTLDAQCLIELGQFEAALQATTLADSLARGSTVDAGTQLRAMLTRGHALSRLRKFQSARQVLDEAARVAEERGDRSAQAQTLRLMADTWRHSVFSRYISLTERAHEVFTAAGDEDGAGECARILAYLFSPSSPVRFDRWYGAARAATKEGDVRANAWLARSTTIAMAARLDFGAGEHAARQAIEDGESAGAMDVVADGLGSRVQCLVGLGRLPEAVETAERLLDLANAQANPRMQIASAALAAQALLRGGQAARAAEELAHARNGLADFGTSEQYEVALAEALTDRDRGHWDPAIRRFGETHESAAESGAELFRLLARADEARVRLMTVTRLRVRDLDGLLAESQSAGAVLIESYVRAIAELAAVLDGDTAPLSEPVQGGCLEEVAIRTDTAALRAELLGEDPLDRWQRARDRWQQLGYTVWLARAQARTGDTSGAGHTLDVLDSPAEARAWALGGTTN